MRACILGLAVTAAFALALPATAQDQVEEQEPEIVIEGNRQRDQQISDFVGALTRAPVGGQLSRFEEAACPAALGLAPHQNKVVAARMRSVAGAAGIPLGKADCAPNVFVVVARDKKAVIADLDRKYTDARGDRAKNPKQSGPAVVWHMEGLLDQNGVPVGVAKETGDGTGGYYVVELGDGSSRLRPPSRPHFLASVLALEPPAIDGLTTTQLADYAAMRLFARTDPARLDKTAAPTILTILDAPIGAAVPLTLTHWDLGFLKALYGSSEGTYASRQRGEIKGLVKKELEKVRRTGN